MSTDWTAQVDSLLGELDLGLRGIVRKVRSAFGDKSHEILGYRGYGNERTAVVYGRVVKCLGVRPSTDGDSTLRNLLNTYRRIDSDPLGYAQLAIESEKTTTLLKADDEGFFHTQFDFVSALDKPDEWIDFDVELLAPVRPGSVITGKGEILIPPASARFGVISDIDDTVIQSRVSNFLLAARTVVLGNARTRLPFPGVAAFYEALRNGAAGDERNPLFYVSSSPWNIFDVITEFLDLQKIPKGPVILRDWDLGLAMLSSTRHLLFKGAVIRSILSLYPELPFILIGDSSQHDPEIYSEIVKEFPGRIRCIYIRDVTRSAERTASVDRLAKDVLAANSTLVIAEDTYGAAKHAVSQGWIASGSLDAIHDEKHADEGKTDEKVPAPDGGEPTSGKPPVVVN